MLRQVVALSRESKGLKAVLPEVMLQVRSMDAMAFAGIKRALDLQGVCARINRLALLRAPVLHHHGDAGGAAAIFFLPDERNVKPDAGRGRKDKAAETQNA